MKKRSQIAKLAEDIKSLKIQSASTITLTSLAVIKEEIKKGKIKTLTDLKETFSLITSARLNEPFVFNCFDYFLWQIEKRQIKDVKQVVIIFDLLLSRLEIIKEQITDNGSVLIKNNFNVFTHCHSTNVENILKKAKKNGVSFQVFLTETRPRFQGRITAENLVNAGIKATMVTDSQASFLVSRQDKTKIDLIILGCDAIFNDGSCFNKIGSYGISLTAKGEKIPLFIAGSLLKFSKALIPIEERPAEEIWDDKPKKLTVLNPAFDKIPSSFISSYISEFGIIKPSNVRKLVKKNYPWIIKTENLEHRTQDIKIASEIQKYSYLYLGKKVAKEKNIIATFRLESEGEIERAANELAAESSIGTWTEVTTQTREIFNTLSAKVFVLDRKTGVIKVAYPLELFEPGNIPQLLSSVAGNIFGMKKIKWIKLLDLELPEKYVKFFPGPQIGADGIRRITEVYNRPLIGSIIKPKIGLSFKDHTRVAIEVFEAGANLVKDDENLTDQSFNPFEKRVVSVIENCKLKIENWRTKIYAFNITAEAETMVNRAKFVKDNCGNCVMVDILTCGFSGLSYLRRQNLGLIIHGHRAMHAALTKNEKHGISMLVIAKLARLAGIDSLHTGTVIGKMEGKKEEVININNFLLSDWYGIKETLPVASGGLHPLLIPDLIKILGNNVILNFGGGIHGHPLGSKAGVIAVRQAMEAVKKGMSLKQYAENHSELKIAINYWKK